MSLPVVGQGAAEIALKLAEESFHVCVPVTVVEVREENIRIITFVFVLLQSYNVYGSRVPRPAITTSFFMNFLLCSRHRALLPI